MNGPAVLMIALLAFTGGAAAALKPGDALPQFARTDLEGRPVRTTELRGKLVLLNFWATWCAPCREEIPVFSRWQKTYGGHGLRVIGISMDDDAASVREFLQQVPASYPIVLGDAKFAAQLGGVLGLPLSYLIDAQGRVIARHQGAVDLPELEATIQERLAGR
ncbi:MAG: TlpA family protein disulfide reductase [Gammaproteobacteria bacterium]|nr:TlpA family protein disulfide reductase [Gammaproteobacteria bacterium]